MQLKKEPKTAEEVCDPKKLIVKKMWNPRWWPRNGCDGKLMVKFLTTTIQVNLASIPSETWRKQYHITWIVVIKNFAISLPSQPFLGRHLGFYIFFHNGLFEAAHFFTAGLFWIRYVYKCVCVYHFHTSHQRKFSAYIIYSTG